MCAVPKSGFGALSGWDIMMPHLDLAKLYVNLEANPKRAIPHLSRVLRSDRVGSLDKRRPPGFSGRLGRCRPPKRYRCGIRLRQSESAVDVARVGEISQ